MLLFRFGGDLLSHVLRRSTIGATALNCRVRDGIGCFARAIATKPKKKHGPVAFAYPTQKHQVVPSLVYCWFCVAFDKAVFTAFVLLTVPGALARLACLAVSGSNQAYRAISTSQLNALLHLHLWPIDVVVFHGSQGRPCFEGGFPLRCLQRLSCPNIATQHYRWHDNWSTSGSFTPVLSY